MLWSGRRGSERHLFSRDAESSERSAASARPCPYGVLHRAPKQRTGSVALELLLILPVFLAMVLGFVEFCMMVSVEERLAAAANQGARVASQGGTTSDVQTAVNNTLGAGAVRTNATVTIFLATDSTMTPVDPTTLPSGTPIAVRVQDPANTVVPDLLTIIGYSISNQVLVGQAVMRKE